MINSKKRCGNKQKFITKYKGDLAMNKKTIAILGTAVLVLSLASVSLAGPMGGGRQWWSWIHVRDWVGAVIHLLEHPVAGPVNLTAPEAVNEALGRWLISGGDA